MYCFYVFQYPLKEVVVIHQDPEALKDIQSLQKYILEVNKLFFLKLSTLIELFQSIHVQMLPSGPLKLSENLMNNVLSDRMF